MRNERALKGRRTLSLWPWYRSESHCEMTDWLTRASCPAITCETRLTFMNSRTSSISSSEAADGPSAFGRELGFAARGVWDCAGFARGLRSRRISSLNAPAASCSDANRPSSFVWPLRSTVALHRFSSRSQRTAGGPGEDRPAGRLGDDKPAAARFGFGGGGSVGSPPICLLSAVRYFFSTPLAVLPVPSASALRCHAPGPSFSTSSRRCSTSWHVQGWALENAALWPSRHLISTAVAVRPVPSAFAIASHLALPTPLQTFSRFCSCANSLSDHG